MKKKGRCRYTYPNTKKTDMKKHVKLFEDFSQMQSPLMPEDLMDAIESKYGPIYQVDCTIGGNRDLIAVAAGNDNSLMMMDDFILRLQDEYGESIDITDDVCDANEVDDVYSFMEDLERYTQGQYPDVTAVLQELLETGAIQIWGSSDVEEFARQMRKYGA
jgi:hypothetical protein